VGAIFEDGKDTDSMQWLRLSHDNIQYRDFSKEEAVVVLSSFKKLQVNLTFFS